MLEIGLLLDCRRLYPNGDWVFQQDGAPAHTNKTTQEYLDGATPFEKMSGLRRAQIATQWTMRSGTRCFKRFMPGNRTNSQRTN